MLASQIARLLNGKRLGHGKYLARCPAHDDSKPSLHIRSGRKCVLLKCWPGCTAEEIVRAMGLKMRDLWYESETITPEISQKLKDENKLRSLHWQHGVWIVAQVIWKLDNAEELRLEEEIRKLTFKLFPHRKAAYDLQVKIRTLGWDRMWEEYFRENPRIEKSNPIVQPLQTTLF